MEPMVTYGGRALCSPALLHYVYPILQAFITSLSCVLLKAVPTTSVNCWRSFWFRSVREKWLLDFCYEIRPVNGDKRLCSRSIIVVASTSNVLFWQCIVASQFGFPTKQLGTFSYEAVCFAFFWLCTVASEVGFPSFLQRTCSCETTYYYSFSLLNMTYTSIIPTLSIRFRITFGF